VRRHRPVMLNEVIDMLQIKERATIVDGTVGHGGHAAEMLRKAGPHGRLIAFDWDESMIARASELLDNIPGSKNFVHADYRRIPEILDGIGIDKVDAVLLDFGVNLEHFDDVERGFSFQGDAPLDMRMDRSAKETAAAWLGRATEKEIVRVLREYGGERHAGLIAREIVRRRKEGKMRRTSDLVAAVESAVPPRLREKRIHPATRTFQAIRIQVNRELDELQSAIEGIAMRLSGGGRMVTLSYHSGEDAAAKNAFRELAKSGKFQVLTKTPLRPSEGEIDENPSSRSAKLRAIERIHIQENHS